MSPLTDANPPLAGSIECYALVQRRFLRHYSMKRKRVERHGEKQVGAAAHKAESRASKGVARFRSSCCNSSRNLPGMHTLNRIPSQFCGTSQPQLMFDILPDGVNCFNAEVQIICDFLTADSPSDEFENLKFPIG